MGGAKQSSIPFPRLPRPRRRGLPMRPTATVNANHGVITGAVLWRPITSPCRAGIGTQSPPVGPCGPAIDRSNVARR
jgi:hypothetical protein